MDSAVLELIRRLNFLLTRFVIKLALFGAKRASSLDRNIGALEDETLFK